MFGSIKRKVALAAVVIAGAVALPAGASAATPVPAVPAGGAAACVSLTPGGACASTSRVFSGSATLTGTGGIQVTCTITATLNIASNGTGTVTGVTFSPTPCPTNVPGCTATATATNLGWGLRVINYTGPPNPPAAGFYAAANVSFQNVFSAGCPVPPGVAFNETGELWFRIGAASGSLISNAVVTAPRNVVTNASLGSATVAATLTRGGAALYTK